MINIKFAKILIQLNLLFWVIYNTHFGWNWDATSEIEENCDTIFKVILQSALVIYIMPLFSLYEKTIEVLNKINNEKRES